MNGQNLCALLLPGEVGKSGGSHMAGCCLWKKGVLASLHSVERRNVSVSLAPEKAGERDGLGGRGTLSSKDSLWGPFPEPQHAA